MAGRPSQLDDPAVRDFIVAEIEAGGNLDTAGAKLSPPMTRQAINLWMRGNGGPERAQLRERIEAARHRRNVVGSRVEAAGGQLERSADVRAPRAPTPTQLQSRTAERLSVTGELVRDADAAPGPTVAEFIEECAGFYRDVGEHPAVRAKAMGIMAEYKLGAMVWAERKRLEREAERTEQLEAAEAGDGPLVISLPDSGAHGHGATIDVEVLDG